MKAFMIAIGEHEKLAAITSVAFTWATGLDVEIVTDLRGAADPWSAKIAPLSNEQHLVVDADLLFFRKAVIPEVPVDVFGACPLQRYGRPMADASAAYGGGPAPGDWVSTGLFIASSAHHEAMALARSWMHDGKQHVEEEGRLNCALHQLGLRIARLPQALNVQVMQNVLKAKTMHCGCGKTFPEKVRETHYYLAHHAHAELRSLLATQGLFDAEKHRESERALRVSRRPTLVARVSEPDLLERGNDDIAEVVGAHGTPDFAGVAEFKNMAQLVRQHIYEQHGFPGAIIAVDDGAIKVEADETVTARLRDLGRVAGDESK